MVCVGWLTQTAASDWCFEAAKDEASTDQRRVDTLRQGSTIKAGPRLHCRERSANGFSRPSVIAVAQRHDLLYRLARTVSTSVASRASIHICNISRMYHLAANPSLARLQALTDQGRGQPSTVGALLSHDLHPDRHRRRENQKKMVFGAGIRFGVDQLPRTLANGRLRTPQRAKECGCHTV